MPSDDDMVPRKTLIRRAHLPLAHAHVHLRDHGEDVSRTDCWHSGQVRLPFLPPCIDDSEEIPALVPSDDDMLRRSNLIRRAHLRFRRFHLRLANAHLRDLGEDVSFTDCWQSVVMRREFSGKSLPKQWQFSDDLSGEIKFEELLDVFKALSPFQHPSLQRLLDAGDVNSTLNALVKVQDFMNFASQRRNCVHQKMKILNALYRVLAVLDERVLEAKFAGQSQELPRLKCWDLHAIINMLKFKVLHAWFGHSQFRHHRKVSELISNSDSKYVNPQWRGKLTHEASDYSLYCILDPFSQLIYVGKTLRSLRTRWTEHFRQIVNPHPRRQIPAYPVMRRYGFSNLVCFPLACFMPISDFQLRVLEQDMIHKIRPCLNCPYVQRFSAEKVHGDPVQGRRIVRAERLPRKPFRRKAIVAGVDPVFSSKIKFVESIGIGKDNGELDAGRKKLNITAVAIKLGNCRAKAISACKYVRMLNNRKPSLVATLIHRVETILVGYQRATALRRIGLVSGAKSSAGCLHLAVPFVPNVNFADIVMNDVCTQIRPQLPQGQSCIVKVRYARSKSAKDILVNTKHWASTVDGSRFLCRCDDLCSLLGITAHDGHVCEKLSDTYLCHAVPKQCHIDTKAINTFATAKRLMLSSYDSFVDKSSIVFQKPIVIGSQNVTTTLLDQYCLANHFQGCGLLEWNLLKWKAELDPIAVVTPLDKGRHTLAISCPLHWQERVEDLCLHKADVEVGFDRDVECRFEDLALLVGYSGIKVDGPHEWGQLCGWPKASGITTKMRPLGSYFKHRFRALMRVACRMLNFMVFSLFGNSGLFPSVCSYEAVRLKVHNFNTDNNDRVIRGFRGQTVVGKRDIDSFFNRVPHGLICDSMNWLQNEWSANFRRRKYVVIPKVASDFASKISAKPQSFSRSFKNYIRNIIASEKKKPRPHNSKVAAHDHYVLLVAHLVDILKFDLECGYAMFGQTPLLTLLGMVQGSPLAPGVCNLCCVFLEQLAYKSLVINKFLNFCFQRWVDDIYVVVTAWAESSRISSALLLDRANIFLDSIFKIYGNVFDMKVEDARVFVGLDVQISDHQIIYAPARRPVEVPCFQHFDGARPYAEKRGVVISQIYSIMDRVCGCSVRPHLGHLFDAFSRVGFPDAVLRSAVQRVAAVHPYLRDDLFAHFQQVQ